MLNLVIVTYLEVLEWSAGGLRSIASSDSLRYLYVITKSNVSRVQNELEAQNTSFFWFVKKRTSGGYHADQDQMIMSTGV